MHPQGVSAALEQLCQRIESLRSLQSLPALAEEVHEEMARTARECGHGACVN